MVLGGLFSMEAARRASLRNYYDAADNWMKLKELDPENNLLGYLDVSITEGVECDDPWAKETFEKNYGIEEGKRFDDFKDSYTKRINRTGRTLGSLITGVPDEFKLYANDLKTEIERIGDGCSGRIK